MSGVEKAEHSPARRPRIQVRGDPVDCRGPQQALQGPISLGVPMTPREGGTEAGCKWPVSRGGGWADGRGGQGDGIHQGPSPISCCPHPSGSMLHGSGSAPCNTVGGKIGREKCSGESGCHHPGGTFCLQASPLPLSPECRGASPETLWQSPSLAGLLSSPDSSVPESR